MHSPSGAILHYSLDGENRLENAVIIFREALSDWARDGELLIIYDHTFGTNAYGLKLGAFVGIDNNRRAHVYGYSFVARESRETFQWLLRVWLSIFKKPPSVLLTDGDPHLSWAVADVFGALYEAIYHLLCIWHLAQNLFKHVAHCFSAVSKGKRGGIRMGWVKLNRERLIICCPFFSANFLKVCCLLSCGRF